MNYCFGVDYYPEHWPRERWAEDARMMREMGVSIVRMAEFSWALFEPSEGCFHFEPLDAAIETLAEEGIDCILGTPTAAPPAWIIRRSPEIQPMDAHGLRRGFGGRHHDCQSNPLYREHIRRYVTAFAEHYAHNPHVVGWQVDNELGNSHGDLCFCPSCEKRFRQWLIEKYGDIGTLNRCWGTAFWSQQYDAFEQVQAPHATVTGQNPSQMLDWKRFCSDLVCEFHQFQADILRKAAPDKFITHNMMGFSDKVSYYELAKQLDFASQDQYPGGHFRPRLDVSTADLMAAELDFIRSVKHHPFWVMEQQSGITGWEILGRTPRPGQLALWATQSIAHGADTVVFFRWRSCLMGTEQYWHGILPHNGIPGRYYHEIRSFMHRMAPLLSQLQGSMPQSEAGILFSYDQEYALSIQPHHPQLGYISHILTYYSALYRRGVPVDFITEGDDFSRYPVLIAPLQFLTTPTLADKLKAYVRGGGTLVMTLRSGIKDENNLCLSEGPLPGLFDELCGLDVTEYDCLRDTDGLVEWDGERYPCELWSDITSLTTASALAVYAKEFYAGTPAIAYNKYGAGGTFYVGTQMSGTLADRFVRELTDRGLIKQPVPMPEGVEITHREKDGKRWYFVMNHTDQPKMFKAPEGWKPCFDDRTDQLAPYAANVYMAQNA